MKKLDRTYLPFGYEVSSLAPGLFVKDWQVQLLTRQDVYEIVGQHRFHFQGCEDELITYLHPCFNQIGVVGGDLRRKRPIEQRRIMHRKVERAYQNTPDRGPFSLKCS